MKQTDFTLQEASAELAKEQITLSPTTLRSYIRQNKIAATLRSNRHFVTRRELSRFATEYRKPRVRRTKAEIRSLATN